MGRKLFLLFILSSYLFCTNYDIGLDFYKKRNYDKAMNNFQIASNNNDNKAMLAIGIMYANGDGVKRDIKQAIKWYNKAAENGNSYAYSKLGNFYASKKDYKKAFKWFLKAAKIGDNKAAYNLGYFYTGGLGIARDLKKALHWYEVAAKAGNIDAQLNLGFAYIGGHGTKVDYKQASYWIKKAKDAGSTKAKLLWDEFKLKASL